MSDGAAGYGTFLARAETGGEVVFEFTLLPLIHTGSTINRLLGAITAVERPFWLGTKPLVKFEILEVRLHWPDGEPAVAPACDVVRLPRKRFRVVEGGLSQDPS